jgi:hypothetical protein
MTIEEVIKTCRSILTTHTKSGDPRCFFEDEQNKILYIFGPTNYIRKGFPSQQEDNLEVLEFENGPYISIGEEILSGKYALEIGITYDHGIPLVSIFYDTKQIEKKKKRKKKNK